MTTKTTSRRGQRRPDLLDAAQRLFFAKGYSGTTMEQVARAAGLSKRAVYLYFTNKDELFVAVAEQGLLMLREQLEAIDVPDRDVEGRIAAVVDIYLEFARREPDYFHMIFREATAEMIDNISEDMRRRVEDHEHACLNVVASTVDTAIAQGMVPAIDRWETAVMFWGAVTGILLLSLGGSQTVFGRRNREELVHKAVWIIYEGLKIPDGYRHKLANGRLFRQGKKP